MSNCARAELLSQAAGLGGGAIIRKKLWKSTAYVVLSPGLRGNDVLYLFNQRSAQAAEHFPCRKGVETSKNLCWWTVLRTSHTWRPPSSLSRPYKDSSGISVSQGLQAYPQTHGDLQREGFHTRGVSWSGCRGVYCNITICYFSQWVQLVNMCVSVSFNFQFV